MTGGIRDWSSPPRISRLGPLFTTAIRTRTLRKKKKIRSRLATHGSRTPPRKPVDIKGRPPARHPTFSPSPLHIPPPPPAHTPPHQTIFFFCLDPRLPFVTQLGPCFAKLECAVFGIKLSLFRYISPASATTTDASVFALYRHRHHWRL